MYEINDDNINEFIQSMDKFPEVIPSDAGLDYKDEKTVAALPRRRIGGSFRNKRIVRLEITSFRGISWNAVHYYGKLKADGIEFQYIDNPNHSTSNWDAKKLNPFYQWLYEFDLYRPITKEEIENDPDRWEYYEVGDMTTCFDKKEEIIEVAKECFKRKFSGDWELWVEDFTVLRNNEYQIEI